jgi:hypothetical protein
MVDHWAVQRVHYWVDLKAGLMVVKMVLQSVDQRVLLLVETKDLHLVDWRAHVKVDLTVELKATR